MHGMPGVNITALGLVALVADLGKTVEGQPWLIRAALFNISSQQA